MLMMASDFSSNAVSRSHEVMSGAPGFAGTRVPVRTLLDYFAGGDKLEDFLKDFTTVSRDQAIALIRASNESLMSSEV